MKAKSNYTYRTRAARGHSRTKEKIMKTITIIFLALCTCSAGAWAKGGGHSGGVSTGSHSVSGHVTKNGTYVAPTRASNPNGTRADNYSTKGNVNPYNGKAGTRDH